MEFQGDVGRIEAGTGWYNEPIDSGEGFYGYGTVADFYRNIPPSEGGIFSAMIPSEVALARRSQIPSLQPHYEYHPQPYVLANPPPRRGRSGRPAVVKPPASLSTTYFGFNPGGEFPGFWTLDGVRIEGEPPPGAAGPVWSKDLNRAREGGLVRNFQEGGLASLLQGGSPVPAAPVEAQLSEEVVSGDGRQEAIAVFSEARVAIEGNHPNPNVALERFVELFGIDALEKLRDIVKGDLGDGMSDSIPGTIDGEEEVALSEGEFVVPSDAVSGIGNGSTNAGARRLMDMVDQVRVARTGTPGQAPAIDPAQMGIGGLIRR
mgnify:CR=1 FL=1